MRRRILYEDKITNVGMFPDAKVGNYLCADADGNKIMIEDASGLQDGYEVIGVVVIPSSHDVYGTGECAVMSLKYMNYTTPDEGSTSTQGIYWGGYGDDITGLTNYTSAATIGKASAQTETVTFSGYPYLPSDSFTATTCVKDTNAYYYSSGNTAAPSPYLTDGSRNSQYYTTSSTTTNALSDFDGVGNTNILTGLATGQSDWKTDATISNEYGSGYYPAACCCWRYHTTGTNQGEWYLPACGELGYVCARRNAINNAIQYLIDNQIVTDCALVTTNVFWSSSESDSNIARLVAMLNGYVNNYGKTSNGYVRAFLRVKP